MAAAGVRDNCRTTKGESPGHIKNTHALRNGAAQQDTTPSRAVAQYLKSPVVTDNTGQVIVHSPPEAHPPATHNDGSKDTTHPGYERGKASQAFPLLVAV